MKQLIVLFGVLGGSLSSVFVRWSDAPSLVLAVYRMLFTVILLAPLALRHKSEFSAFNKKVFLLCLASGVALGLHFTTFFSAVQNTSIAAATVLVDMEVLFVALATMVVFRRRLAGKAWLAMLLAFTGAVGIALADTSGAAAGNALFGDVMALLAALLLGIYTMIGSVCRKTVSTTAYTYVVYVAALVTVVAVALVSGTPLTGYASENYLNALGMAICCTLLGHSIFSWGLKYLQASFVSTIRLMDCVFSMIWGMLLFSEYPSPVILVGGVLIIAGVLLYSRIAAEEP